MSQFALRLPDSLHNRARVLADRDHTSLNQFIAIAVAEKISTLETSDFFRERAARGDVNKLNEILDNVPDVKPLESDEIVSHNISGA